MALNARNKGKAGELEFIKKFEIFFDHPLKRHLDQWREGGSDIEGCEPWVIEVKRCEKLEHNKWWAQVNKAVSAEEEIPVVAYRRNMIKYWTFQVPVTLMGIEHPGFALVHEDIWLQLVLRK